MTYYVGRQEVRGDTSEVVKRGRTLAKLNITVWRYTWMAKRSSSRV
jgi:hypothetical protein